MQERDGRHRCARGEEGEEIAHRVDAAAPSVGGVAGDDEVVDGDLRIDRRHRHGERHDQHLAAGLCRPQHAQELETCDHGEQKVGREFLHQSADRDLGERAAHEHRRRHAADQDERHLGAEPLIHDFRQRNRDDVENEAGAERDHDEQAEDARRQGGAERNIGYRAAACVLSFFVRDEPQIDDGGDDADHARHQEGCAPSQAGDERRCRAGGERCAEIAANAVEGERAAAHGRVLDQHGGADGMVDRREQAERRERNGEHDEIRREASRHERKAAAGVEHRHHVTPAPVVAKPARRQREHTKSEEGRRAERDQFGVAAAVNDLQPDHHRREDQHHVMVERMRPIDEADGELGFARNRRRRRWRWHGAPMMNARWRLVPPSMRI